MGKGTEVRIVETTRYPFEETVRFTVHTPRPVAFPLYLRLPSWCAGPVVKVNVAGGRGGGGGADPTAARAQIDQSFARLKKAKLDLIQVHNLADIPTQLGILKEIKQQGRIRYIGVTTTFDQQYSQIVDIMRVTAQRGVALHSEG